MPRSVTTPSFAMLVQRFFTEHLTQHRAVSPRTVAAYGDTFRLLLQFAERHTCKSPTRLQLVDLDAKLVLAFLDHLERDRNNGARSRNARLAALRSFLKYAAHHDLSALGVIEQALAVPMKRFDRPMLGFLTRQEMQAILDAPDTAAWAGQRDHALFTMLYNTGRTRLGDHRSAGREPDSRHLTVGPFDGQGTQAAERAAVAIDCHGDASLEAALGDDCEQCATVPKSQRQRHVALECHAAAGAGGRGGSRDGPPAERPIDLTA